MMNKHGYFIILLTTYIIQIEFLKIRNKIRDCARRENNINYQSCIN